MLYGLVRAQGGRLKIPFAKTAMLLALAGSASCLSNNDQICDQSGCAFSNTEWSRLQSLTGLGPPPLDASNRVDQHPEAIAFGQMLFNDPRFSGNATQIDALKRPAAVARAPQGQPTNLSCASCHNLARAGADTASVPGNVSSGAGWTDVNALPLDNVAYQHLFTWNGRADSLWAQAFAVAENPVTMNGNRLNTAWVIFNDTTKLLPAYNMAFGIQSPFPLLDATYPKNGKPGNGTCDPTLTTEPFGDAYDCMTTDQQTQITRVLVNWAKALAAYEATLVSGDTPFDQFMREGPTSNAITQSAKRGARLFVGKAGCIDCHSTPLFSDKLFHNVGVPQIGPDVPLLADCPAGNTVCDCVSTPAKNCLPFGAFDGRAKLNAASNKMLRTGTWSDDPGDTSRADAYAPATDDMKGAWRTPSLRNVALTAPYMHDGVYQTLQEVVDHYNRGPDPQAVGTAAVDIKPLALTPGEEDDLIAFLQSLSDNGAPAGTQGAPFGGGNTSGGTGIMGMGGVGPSTMGAGGATGAGAAGGGTAGAPPVACLGQVPPSPAILGAGVTGSSYTFAGSSVPPPVLMDSGAGSGGIGTLHFQVSIPGPSTTDSYAGFGVGFGSPNCVDASRYTGIAFTLSGTLDNCVFQAGVAPSEDNDVTYGPAGSCTLGSACVPPFSTAITLPTTSPPTVMVPFTDMSGGNPLATVDASRLNTVQWMVSPAGDAPCTADVTIDRASFY
jgi:cytochrome c peroxidase